MNKLILPLAGGLVALLGLSITGLVILKDEPIRSEILEPTVELTPMQEEFRDLAQQTLQAPQDLELLEQLIQSGGLQESFPEILKPEDWVTLCNLTKSYGQNPPKERTQLAHLTYLDTFWSQTALAPQRSWIQSEALRCALTFREQIRDLLKTQDQKTLPTWIKKQKIQMEELVLVEVVSYPDLELLRAQLDFQSISLQLDQVPWWTRKNKLKNHLWDFLNAKNPQVFELAIQSTWNPQEKETLKVFWNQVEGLQLQLQKAAEKNLDVRDEILKILEPWLPKESDSSEPDEFSMNSSTRHRNGSLSLNLERLLVEPFRP